MEFRFSATAFMGDHVMSLEVITKMFVGVWLAAMLAVPALADNHPPVVSNVTASQRTDGSKLVDIYYNLADADGDACTVWAVISDDGGATFKVPALTFTGHVGPNITPGSGRHIIWDAGADIPGAVLTNCKARVYADDGHGLAPMVLVPGGYYQMGDSHDGCVVSNECPVHTVWISTFRIDKYEVTNVLYCQFLNAGGNDDHWDPNQKILRQGSPGNYYYQTISPYENHPVVCVNYTDAKHFCDWRSTVEGLPAGTYRLPTEAEWEKAAGWNPELAVHRRFGEGTNGGGYNSLDGQRANYLNSGDPFDNGTTPVGFYNGALHNKADFGWPGSQQTYQTQNAQSYYGCYDMCGNVWEWCYDWYSSTYYSSSPSTDPTGPASGTARVLRGGSWNSTPSDCRAAERANRAPSDRYDTMGFRCASGTP
jgi:formylglycine-generating enzyme required for sulfatase activity